MIDEFGYIFRKSISDFKVNFKDFFKTGLFLYFIPILLVNLLNLYKPDSWSFFVLEIINFVLLSLFFIYIVLLLNGKVKNIFDKSFKKLGKFLFFQIILVFILLFLYLLLVIPGIIFSIFWVFSSIIFILNDNIKISDALKNSKKIVNGNWWRVFGFFSFFILFSIFCGFIYGLSFEFVLTLSNLSDSFVSVFFNSGFQMLLSTFSIIFNYNVYKFFVDSKKRNGIVRKINKL